MLVVQDFAGKLRLRPQIKVSVWKQGLGGGAMRGGEGVGG